MLFLVFSVFLVSVNAQLDLAFCQGCIYGNRCISLGAQTIVDREGSTVYCDFDKEVKDTKESGVFCDNNFECQSFYCSGTCQEIQAAPEESNIKMILSFTLAVLFILVVIFLVVKNRSSVKSKPKSVNPVKKSTVSVKSTTSVSTSSRKDALEKKLDKSFEELKGTVGKK